LARSQEKTDCYQGVMEVIRVNWAMEDPVMVGCRWAKEATRESWATEDPVTEGCRLATMEKTRESLVTAGYHSTYSIGFHSAKEAMVDSLPLGASSRNRFRPPLEWTS